MWSDDKSASKRIDRLSNPRQRPLSSGCADETPFMQLTRRQSGLELTNHATENDCRRTWEAKPVAPASAAFMNAFLCKSKALSRLHSRF